MLKAFRGSIIASLVVLALVAYYTRSPAVLLTCVILAVLELTLSFDNAVVNAKYLVRMSPLWQKLFLTVGIVIAVFGMRLVFPIVIVQVTAGIGFTEVIDLAFNDTDGYAEKLEGAKHAIYAFGGIFLLMIALDWLFEEKDIKWLGWIEGPLERAGKLDKLSVLIAGLAIVAGAKVVPPDEAATVLFAGMTGLLTYLAVSGLDAIFGENEDEAGDEILEGSSQVHTGLAGVHRSGSGVGPAMATAGKAGFSTFLYLEVLDASFSFDGVIGAFAISQNIIVIAAGLGIGAIFVRSMTVYLVRQGTLAQYRYLEHGAHWAILGLAICLLLELKFHLGEAVTGGIGITFIAIAFYSSLRANKRDIAEGREVETLHA